MNSLALITAWQAHEGQKRKGSDIPYIVHPIEVAVILMQNGADEEVISAGLLHDTLEDTNVTLQEIKDRFGDRVAELVMGASEPHKVGLTISFTNDQEKSSWKERKEHTIIFLSKAHRDIKLIACADKLSNSRSMVKDFEAVGNKLWGRFNASCKEQKWYYEELVKNLEDISNYKMYQEFSDNVEKLFNSSKVIDFINSQEGY